jgi:hypothetical protein
VSLVYEIMLNFVTQTLIAARTATFIVLVEGTEGANVGSLQTTVASFQEGLQALTWVMGLTSRDIVDDLAGCNGFQTIRVDAWESIRRNQKIVKISSMVHRDIFQFISIAASRNRPIPFDISVSCPFVLAFHIILTCVLSPAQLISFVSPKTL